MARSYLTAFPAIKVTIEAQVESGDMVVTCSVATGTNSGELNGKPATGKAMRVKGISMVRFVDGKIVEEWERAKMRLVSPLPSRIKPSRRCSDSIEMLPSWLAS